MPSSSRPTVHLIGHAHLDPVWLWRGPEGFAEARATFRSALYRMKETPGYIFTCSAAAVYEWVEQSDPDLFREVQRRVREGRWVIAGGWWIQADCNIPCAESAKGLIVRAVEWSGRRRRGRFELPDLRRAWSAEFRGGEIKTFLVPDDGRSRVREVNMLEEGG